MRVEIVATSIALILGINALVSVGVWEANAPKDSDSKGGDGGRREYIYTEYRG